MSLKELINESKSFFVFNNRHIYTVKNHNEKWCKIDSLSGIIPINIDKLHGKNMGFIIPRDTIKLEFDKMLIMNKLKNFINKNNIKTVQDAINWFNKNYKTLLLGDIEVWLSHLEQILKKINEPNRYLNKLINKFHKNKNDELFLRRNLLKFLVSSKLITPININKQ